MDVSEEHEFSQALQNLAISNDSWIKNRDMWRRWDANRRQRWIKYVHTTKDTLPMSQQLLQQIVKQKMLR